MAGSSQGNVRVAEEATGFGRRPAQVQEMIAGGDPLFRELSSPNWRFVELPTGHWPMFSRPDDLAGLLLKLSSEEHVPSGARGSSGQSARGRRNGP